MPVVSTSRTCQSVAYGWRYAAACCRKTVSTAVSNWAADGDGLEYVGGRVLHGLLRDLHLLADGREQVELAQAQTEGRQTGAGRLSAPRFGTGKRQHRGSPSAGSAILSRGLPHFPLS